MDSILKKITTKEWQQNRSFNILSKVLFCLMFLSGLFYYFFDMNNQKKLIIKFEYFFYQIYNILTQLLNILKDYLN